MMMAMTTRKSKREVIEHLQLLPHPEGGYYRETYRAGEVIVPDDGRGPRAACTAIYFLLGLRDKSHLHRIKSDEMWHFYGGVPLTIIELNEHTRSFNRTVLGGDIFKGQVLQHVVPKNTWFGSYVSDGHGSNLAIPSSPGNEDEDDLFTLVGCTVAPGFDFLDFELAIRESLSASFPDVLEVVHFLTPESISYEEPSDDGSQVTNVRERTNSLPRYSRDDGEVLGS